MAIHRGPSDKLRCLDCGSGFCRDSSLKRHRATPGSCLKKKSAEPRKSPPKSPQLLHLPNKTASRRSMAVHKTSDSGSNSSRDSGLGLSDPEFAPEERDCSIANQRLPAIQPYQPTHSSNEDSWPPTHPDLPPRAQAPRKLRLNVGNDDSPKGPPPSPQSSICPERKNLLSNVRFGEHSLHIYYSISLTGFSLGVTCQRVGYIEQTKLQ